MIKVVRVAIVAALLASGAARAQEPSLTAAWELYGAAEYAGALTMLDALAAAPPSARDRQTIELYRALCLVALDRQPEATKVIEGMVTADPLYRPDSKDLPPRMLTAFSDARKRLLPAIVQQRYAVARAAFEQQQYATAMEGFKLVLDGLADPELDAASRPPLSDLKLLASGFHELASKSAQPPAAPTSDPGARAVTADIEVDTPSAAPHPAVEPAAAAATSRAAPGRIYEPTDMTVVPPITVRQVVPPFSGRLPRGAVASVEVVIDEKGRVESASMVVPLTPAFDRSVLDAARSWQYRPATVDGTPVKYRKRLQLAVSPTGER